MGRCCTRKGLVVGSSDMLVCHCIAGERFVHHHHYLQQVIGINEYKFIHYVTYNATICYISRLYSHTNRQVNQLWYSNHIYRHFIQIFTYFWLTKEFLCIFVIPCKDAQRYRNVRRGGKVVSITIGIKEIFVGITNLFEPLKLNATMTKLKRMKTHLNRNIENPYLHLMPAGFNCGEDIYVICMYMWYRLFILRHIQPSSSGS